MSHRRLLRVKRHRRIRKRVAGTSLRPRLCVFRSNKHIYAQVIDDDTQRTLVSASSLDREVRDRVTSGGTVDAARVVGETVARRAVSEGVTQVVFDRGGYVYHGRVQALADGARGAGLEF